METIKGKSDTYKARQSWMSILARTPQIELERFFKEYPSHVLPIQYIRQPETGMVMVRGRAGEDGAPFNMGEATVTRCTVKLAEKYTGTSYVLGRSHRHAELAAIYDALLQHPDHYKTVFKKLIHPMEDTLKLKVEKKSQKTAGTKVDFFTMVRGE